METKPKGSAGHPGRLPLAVVIPTLNCARTLPATLDSIVELARAGAEIVVVDSGSTDGTREICLQHGIEVRYAPPGNLYAAVNEGVRQTTAAWVTYLNGDDLLNAPLVAKAVSGAVSEVDVLYGNITHINLDGRRTSGFRSLSPGLLKYTMLKRPLPIPQQGTLIRREALARIGGFDERFRYVADAVAFRRLFQAGATFQKYGPHPAAAFRLHPGQISTTRRREMEEESLRQWPILGLPTRHRASRLTLALIRLLNIDNILRRIAHGRLRSV